MLTANHLNIQLRFNMKDSKERRSARLFSKHYMRGTVLPHNGKRWHVTSYKLVDNCISFILQPLTSDNRYVYQSIVVI